MRGFSLPIEPYGRFGYPSPPPIVATARPHLAVSRPREDASGGRDSLRLLQSLQTVPELKAPRVIDYEVQRCTRHCAVSGRELAGGETVYSVLLAQGADLKRLDYAADAWPGPPEVCIGWWKSQMPTRESKRAQMAPGEVLLEFFTGLAEQPERQDVRYVMALWLVRRRMLRLDATEPADDGVETLILHCPRDESTHRVRTAVPNAARAAEIQTELSQLLYTQAN